MRCTTGAAFANQNHIDRGPDLHKA